MNDFNNINIGECWKFNLTNGSSINSEVMEKGKSFITVLFNEEEIYLPFLMIKSYEKDNKSL